MFSTKWESNLSAEEEYEMMINLKDKNKLVII